MSCFIESAFLTKRCDLVRDKIINWFEPKLS